MEIIKSISFSQAEILQNIVDLHTGPVQADVTFGAGCFYKEMELPRFRFDLNPKPFKHWHPNILFPVIPADVCHLPIKDSCLRSVAFDPPFMARTGPGATLKARFGELVGTIKDLWNFYFLAMREIHRVLAPGGWLIFKCQDGVLSGVNNFTHVQIYNEAVSMGFKPVDLFVLLAKHRMNHPKHDRQIHARKFHSFFWVFQKRR